MWLGLGLGIITHSAKARKRHVHKAKEEGRNNSQQVVSNGGWSGYLRVEVYVDMRIFKRTIGQEEGLRNNHDNERHREASSFVLTLVGIGIATFYFCTCHTCQRFFFSSWDETNRSVLPRQQNYS